MSDEVLVILVLAHLCLVCHALFSLGSCPEVTGNPFNCLEIVEGLNSARIDEKELTVYAVLPSSPQVETLNMFAYHINPTNINSFHPFLNCILAGHNGWDNDNINFQCNTTFGLSTVLPAYALNKTVDGEFLVKLDYIDKCPKQKCYQYVSYTKFSRYFAIWGCYQINETLHDRGLWIFGGDENASSQTIENIIDEALNDMNLNVLANLRDALVIRNADLQAEPCYSSRYYHDGLTLVGDKPISASRQQVWVWNKEKLIIIFGVLLIAVILGLLTSFTCIKILNL